MYIPWKELYAPYYINELLLLFLNGQSVAIKLQGMFRESVFKPAFVNIGYIEGSLTLKT